jgi:hypothetical protein
MRILVQIGLTMATEDTKNVTKVRKTKVLSLDISRIARL